MARQRQVADYFCIVDRIPAAMSQTAEPDEPQLYYCFGDYNIEGSFWSVRLSNDPVAAAPVRVFCHDGGGYVVAPSFREFLVRYVSEGPEAMC